MSSRVAVLCVVSNGVEGLGPAIRSVLHQSLSDLRLIVVGARGGEGDLSLSDDDRVELRDAPPEIRAEVAGALLAETQSDYVALLGERDLFRRSKLERAIAALERSEADYCLSNTLYLVGKDEPASRQARADAGVLEDVAGLSASEHLHRLLDPEARLHPGALVARTDLLRRSFRPTGLTAAAADFDLVARVLLGGRGVFLRETLQETPLPSPSASRRERAERLAALRLFRSPDALAQAHRIFPAGAVASSLPESMRLWFAGQQLLKRPEPETQALGLEWLRDALAEHGPEIADRLAASTGVAPAAYVDRVAGRLFTGGGDRGDLRLRAEPARSEPNAPAVEAIAAMLPSVEPSAPAPRTSVRRNEPSRGPGPEIVVVFTCYSGEPYFEDAVASVAAQTYPGVRMVFHDNGCGPSYRALIDRMAVKHDARVIRSEVNRYGEGLRYDVLPFLDSEFVAILHDDDMYEPEKIARSMAEIGARALDYVFTDRQYVDASGAQFPADYEEVNTTPLLPEHFPNQLIADTYYIGLRLHFSTLVMRTDLAKRTLMGDPFLPRITDSLFMQRLLLDDSAEGGVMAEKLTLVRVHGANDMLYTKFDAEGRARELSLLQLGEYICFQELVRTTPTEQLGDILAIFPGVPRIAGEDRVGMLVRAALDLRNWFGSKPLMAAYCIHVAFLIDGRATMERVREFSSQVGGGPATDTNQLTQMLYRKYLVSLSEQLSGPHDAALRERIAQEHAEILERREGEARIARERLGEEHAAALRRREAELQTESKRLADRLGEEHEEALRRQRAETQGELDRLRRGLRDAVEAAEADRRALLEAAERGRRDQLDHAERAHLERLHAAEARVGQAVAETVATIEQSTSWRLTRPVRWAARLGRASDAGSRRG